MSYSENVYFAIGAPIYDDKLCGDYKNLFEAEATLETESADVQVRCAGCMATGHGSHHFLIAQETMHEIGIDFEENPNVLPWNLVNALTLSQISEEFGPKIKEAADRFNLTVGPICHVTWIEGG